MKVVINVCYGGFGLSKRAVSDLYALQCPHVKRVESAGDKYFQHLDVPVIAGGEAWLDDEHRDESRTCPFLVGIVERLGKDSWGGFAELKVVEVPDDVEWTIEEYDGIEWVAEKHRTWS